MLLYVISTKGIKRLRKEERYFYSITDNTGEILVGILMSDRHMTRRTKTSYPRFHFH